MMVFGNLELSTFSLSANALNVSSPHQLVGHLVRTYGFLNPIARLTDKRSLRVAVAVRRTAGGCVLHQFVSVHGLMTQHMNPLPFLNTMSLFAYTSALLHLLLIIIISGVKNTNWPAQLQSSTPDAVTRDVGTFTQIRCYLHV